MFGSYCVINVVVLLNLLIAMMNHSYQIISVSCLIFIKKHNGENVAHLDNANVRYNKSY